MKKREPPPDPLLFPTTVLWVMTGHFWSHGGLPVSRTETADPLPPAVFPRNRLFWTRGDASARRTESTMRRLG